MPHQTPPDRICSHCRRPIGASGAGVAEHAACVQAIIAAAIAAGTHTSQKYAPAQKELPAGAGKEAPHGSGAPKDGRSLNSQPPRDPRGLPPLSDAERRRRFPVNTQPDYEWGEIHEEVTTA